MAESFRVVDTQGRTRATLDVDQEGRSALNLLDENGTGRAILTCSLAGSGLALSHEDGEVSAWLSSSTETGPSLMLFDKHGKITFSAP